MSAAPLELKTANLMSRTNLRYLEEIENIPHASATDREIEALIKKLKTFKEDEAPCTSTARRMSVQSCMLENTPSSCLAEKRLRERLPAIQEFEGC